MIDEEKMQQQSSAVKEFNARLEAARAAIASRDLSTLNRMNSEGQQRTADIKNNFVATKQAHLDAGLEKRLDYAFRVWLNGSRKLIEQSGGDRGQLQ